MSSSRRRFVKRILSLSLLYKNGTLNALENKIIVNDENSDPIAVNKKISVHDYIYPEHFGAVGDGLNDDTNAIDSALKYAFNNGRKSVLLSSLYCISDTVNIPSYISVIGVGEGSGFILKRDNQKKIVMVKFSGEYSIIRNFSILFGCNTIGNIGDIQVYGVLMTDTSQNCAVNEIKINAKYSGRIGFTHGARITGRNNVINNSHILNGSMCISVRGEGHNISSNYLSNNFFSEGIRPWSKDSPQWDGVVMEGCSKCSIIGNIVEGCGQSGIYCGGNGSLSFDNTIKNNIVFNNWNRGIDIGVTGESSDKNGVFGMLIESNHSHDNREPQIWLDGVVQSRVINNFVEISSDYEKKFSGFYGGRVGISLGQKNNSLRNEIIDNTIVLNQDDTAAITIIGTDSIIKSNRMVGKSYWVKDPSVILANTVDNYKTKLNLNIINDYHYKVLKCDGVLSINDSDYLFNVSVVVKKESKSESDSFIIGIFPGLKGKKVKVIQLQVDLDKTLASELTIISKFDEDSRGIIISMVTKDKSGTVDMSSLDHLSYNLHIHGFFKVQ
jgi:hypothetical protein